MNGKELNRIKKILDNNHIKDYDVRPIIPCGLCGAKVDEYKITIV